MAKIGNRGIEMDAKDNGQAYPEDMKKLTEKTSL